MSEVAAQFYIFSATARLWLNQELTLDVCAAQAKELLTACREAGVNFFDNAEVYAKGHAEEIMGKAFKVCDSSHGTGVTATMQQWLATSYQVHQAARPGQPSSVLGLHLLIVQQLW